MNEKLEKDYGKVIYLGDSTSFSDKIKLMISPLELISYPDAKIDHLNNIISSKTLIVAIIIDCDIPYNNSALFEQIIHASSLRKKVPLIKVVNPKKEESFRKSFYGDRFFYSLKNVLVEDIVFNIQRYFKKYYKEEFSTIKKTVKVFASQKAQIVIPIDIHYKTPNYLLAYCNHPFQDGDVLDLEIEGFNQFFTSSKYRIKKNKYNNNKYLASPYELEFMPFRNSTGEAMIKRLQSVSYDVKEKGIDIPYIIGILEAIKPKKLSFFAKEESVDNYEVENKDIIEKYRALYFDSLAKEEGVTNKIRRNITFYSENLDFISIFYQEEALVKAYDPVFRPTIQNPREEVLSDKSALYVISFSENNNFYLIKELVTSLTQFLDYFPFFLIFNYDGELDVETFRDQVGYHYIITTNFSPNIEIVKRLLLSFEKKFGVIQEKRVSQILKSLKKDFPFNEHNKSLLYPKFKKFREPLLAEQSLNIWIIWISEYEVVFTSGKKFQEGEVFYFTIPFRIPVKVIQHPEESRELNFSNCYRGLVMCLNENEMNTFRQYVYNIEKAAVNPDNPILMNMTHEIKQSYSV